MVKSHEIAMIPVLVIFSYVGTIKGCNTSHQPRDVVYILDKSGSITADNWYQQIEFLKNLTRHLDISANRTRVAALKHAGKTKIIFGLNDKGSKEEVITALDEEKEQTRSGISQYHKALDYSVNDILKPSARHNARKFIVGLTDDVDKRLVSNKTKAHVREAMNLSIGIITICMKIHMDCLEASTPGFNVSVSSPKKLEEAVPVVINLICNSVDTSSCEFEANCLPANGTYRTDVKLEELKDLLKVNMDLLSKTKRRKSSADDNRFSSAVIGYCSVSVLAFVGSWIVIPDFWTLINWILKNSEQSRLKKYFNRVKD